MITHILNKFLDFVIIMLPKVIKNRIRNNTLSDYRYANMKSYSQEGEDLILSRFFGEYGPGFYVDVGAHHPRRFSNTKMFYMKGWRGINLDAMPGAMKQFEQERPEDINIEQAISNKKQRLKYIIFNEPALNTFSDSYAQKIHNDSNPYQITDSIELETQTLTHMLDKHMPKDMNIDFLSVDVEGHDMEVINSLDFTKYRPSMVLIEYLDCDFEMVRESELYKFMLSHNYKLVSKTFFTLFFKHSS